MIPIDANSQVGSAESPTKGHLAGGLETSKDYKDFLFRTGYVRRRDWIGFATSSPEGDALGVPNGRLLTYVRNEWYCWDVAWTPIGLTSTAKTEKTVVLIGREGNAVVATPSGYEEERVETSGVGPVRHGPLRQVRTVDGDVFAVGM